MRFSMASLCLIASLLSCTTTAFAPTSLGRQKRLPSTARSFGVDPSHWNDVISSASSFTLADLDATVNGAVINAITDTVINTDGAADMVAADASNSGWFGFLTLPIQGLLGIIHTGVAGVGTANAWGLSIILLTLLIKVVTFPLTKTQLESTNKMQAMQPAIKEIQSKYQSNPEVMNQKMAEFYQVNEINPLAGCLPSLVQIPVFIGLYRAVLDLAKMNTLDESFLFLPNLEGPTYGADPASATDWLLKGWVDGVPSLGWDDTIAFLILPVFLVISQFISMELMQPKTDDPTQQQTNVILKILPIMIGWFALSVPAALSIYWVTNNIVTTATTLWIRKTMQVDPPKTGGGGGAAAATMEAPSIFAPPPREKPVGFGAGAAAASASEDVDGVKPLTVVDAEIVGEDDMPAPKPQRRKVKKKKRRNK